MQLEVCVVVPAVDWPIAITGTDFGEWFFGLWKQHDMTNPALDPSGPMLLVPLGDFTPEEFQDFKLRLRVLRAPTGSNLNVHVIREIVSWYQENIHGEESFNGPNMAAAQLATKLLGGLNLPFGVREARSTFVGS